MATTKKKTVFVGMSGGVDSSVTAAILKYGRPSLPAGRQDYDIVGVHLRCWNIDGCAEQDAEDARRASETLGIPFYVFDFEREYKERVVEYMVDGYRRGITPNPDVMCNSQIKFGLFYDRALKMGADYIATGHYVRLKRLRTKHYVLSTARDPDKDQSYFLWTLTQEQLAHCLFPLGDLIKKTEVRKLAKKYKLPNADKKDSQGVCFLGQISLPEFLAGFIPDKQGKIVDISGKELGQHTGAHHFTIGQRKGLGVGGFAKPQYVAKKDIKTNTVTLAPESDPSLYASSVELTDLNVIDNSYSNVLKNIGIRVLARIRYRQPLFGAKLEKGKKKKEWLLTFDHPQKFIAPGQSAVMYDAKGKMLGGGIIKNAK
ncbi:MAG: tRNA 2-thiouridine(34) synthase MnmA [Candidatus Harrisonbacteria bacterium CG10_big_fil_rev_8_21_14_0_10_49_15]|uniref:tRNA-specific 2-thiouridylase MnmA n=1 Tax=Candidatus Harrisonbacteria bacterium CG10_big_fil_rev_8_21_14_0_10_49_15 TaxID=1974587 RepID=A0A2H0UKK9_9BACT|nr:MAG: tRNA 2-thiouridine(34) synthase MnmA [Candidatus Harrisonbacteria bacterium CG10_big_fil_rev_8_21_14_0_10_49_15]